MNDELILHRLADLDDAALARLYEPPTEPWLRVNFVTTVDGATQGPDGLSKSINNPADKRVFTMLRRQADCLVVGAATLRAEEYQIPRLPLVVVSRTGEVPVSLHGAPPERVLMATVSTAPGLADARSRLGQEQVLVLGDESVDLAALKTALAERGWVDQLCEGGAHLFGAMLAAGVVDELCHTTVPRLIGGQQLRLVAGVDVDVPLSLEVLLEMEGTLLGRWFVG